MNSSKASSTDAPVVLGRGVDVELGPGDEHRARRTAGPARDPSGGGSPAPCRGTCRRAAGWRPKKRSPVPRSSTIGSSPGPPRRRTRCCRRSAESRRRSTGSSPGRRRRSHSARHPPRDRNANARRTSTCPASVSRFVTSRTVATQLASGPRPCRSTETGRVTANGVDFAYLALRHGPAGAVPARLPRLGPHVAPPPARARRRRLPRRRPVHAGLCTDRGARRRPLPNGGAGRDALRAARALGGDAAGRHHRPRLGRAGHLRRRGPRTGRWRQGRRDGRAAAAGRSRQAFLSPIAAQAQLVHVLLPAPAGRRGRAGQRPRVHRPALGRLVARLRRQRRGAGRQGLPARPSQPQGRPRLLPGHPGRRVPRRRPRGDRRQDVAAAPGRTLYCHGAADGCMGVDVAEDARHPCPKVRRWRSSRAPVTSCTSRRPR